MNGMKEFNGAWLIPENVTRFQEVKPFQSISNRKQIPDLRIMFKGDTYPMIIRNTYASSFADWLKEQLNHGQ